MGWENPGGSSMGILPCCCLLTVCFAPLPRSRVLNPPPCCRDFHLLYNNITNHHHHQPPTTTLFISSAHRGGSEESFSSSPWSLDAVVEHCELLPARSDVFDREAWFQPYQVCWMSSSLPLFDLHPLPSLPSSTSFIHSLHPLPPSLPSSTPSSCHTRVPRKAPPASGVSTSGSKQHPSSRPWLRLFSSHSQHPLVLP